jgi:hypothetical protein
LPVAPSGARHQQPVRLAYQPPAVLFSHNKPATRVARRAQVGSTAAARRWVSGSDPAARPLCVPARPLPAPCPGSSLPLHNRIIGYIPLQLSSLLWYLPFYTSFVPLSPLATLVFSYGQKYVCTFFLYLLRVCPTRHIFLLRDNKRAADMTLVDPHPRASTSPALR